MGEKGLPGAKTVGQESDSRPGVETSRRSGGFSGPGQHTDHRRPLHKEGKKIMGRWVYWIGLAGGFLLFLVGMKKLYREGDWTLFLITLLIIGFSLSGLVKGSGGKGQGNGP